MSLIPSAFRNSVETHRSSFVMAHLWGIDLGGTKIEAAVLDSEKPGQPICRRRIATESHLGYDHIRAQLVKLVKEVVAETSLPLPQKIGIGTPGVIDPGTQLLKNSNTQCLNGKPLRADLAADLGLEIITANDANCFALAEATLGAGRGYETVFGIILGTGVGGGIVVNEIG